MGGLGVCSPAARRISHCCNRVRDWFKKASIESGAIKAERKAGTFEPLMLK